MRALSFLFAALLGLALAMIAPALAGPRPEMAPAPLSATEVAAEPAAELAAAADDETVSIEQISRSILEAIGADAA